LLSYGAELRTEKPGDLVRLFDDASGYYEEVTRVSMSIVPFSVKVTAGEGPVRYHARITAKTRRASRLAWIVRSLQGKALSVLRLLKGLFTYQNGLAYILWKIERHSGASVDLPERLQRRPFLGACVIFWRLYRKGAFR
jgi:hypothetical protein